MQECNFRAGEVCCLCGENEGGEKLVKSVNARVGCEEFEILAVCRDEGVIRILVKIGDRIAA